MLNIQYYNQYQPICFIAMQAACFRQRPCFLCRCWPHAVGTDGWSNGGVFTRFIHQRRGTAFDAIAWVNRRESLDLTLCPYVCWHIIVHIDNAQVPETPRQLVTSSRQSHALWCLDLSSRTAKLGPTWQLCICTKTGRGTSDSTRFES